ncbi:uncharacterized protein B0T23DRAFT_433925 [Neurospora hispaniola]|uniref:DUF1772-domain-containing protein n=1 Tax=Neurospora hispaniola TaxID=588809 RepID=A0AAJ0IEJ5_9PEZI|nr:hypothetical protein B0T23DRAFT_433925 [Neurospora hispaniola]
MTHSNCCLLSIPLLTIPTIISPSSSPTAPILLSSWSTLYHHGALTMPPLAFLTASLYGLSAYKLRSSSSSSSFSSSSPRTQKQTQTQTQQRKNEKRSKLFAIAAIATLAIGPLTLLVMSPTNKELMRLNEIQIEPGPLVSDVEEVRELVRRWNWLHIVRSLGPVVGCVVGWFGVFGYGDEEKGEEKVEGEKQ